jgi:hypothetical protein
MQRTEYNEYLPVPQPPPPLFLYCKFGFEHPYVGSPINLAEWSGNVALFSPDGSWIGMTTVLPLLTV